MGSRRVLREAEIREQPHSEWNAFVDVLAMSPLEELDAQQVPAHLVFWYESEVQNGGHFQYFENRGLADVDETIQSLRLLGAASHAEVLTRALRTASGREWGAISSADDFVAEALESELGTSDSDFHECAPPLQEILEAHLREHRDWYIEVRAV